MSASVLYPNLPWSPDSMNTVAIKELTMKIINESTHTDFWASVCGDSFSVNKDKSPGIGGGRVFRHGKKPMQLSYELLFQK